MLDFIIKYWVQVGFGLIVSIIGIIYKHTINHFKKQNDRQKAIESALLGLLHDRLEQKCVYHLKERTIHKETIKDIDYLYKPYKALGGNDNITMMYAKVKTLPINVEREDLFE